MFMLLLKITFFFLLLANSHSVSFASSIYSLTETDGCHRIDIDVSNNIFAITEICSEIKDDYFGKLWEKNNKIFILSNGVKKFNASSVIKNHFQFEALLSRKQQTKKIKFDENYRQLIIQDKNLTDKMSSNFDNANFVNIFLTDGSLWSVLEFESPAVQNKKIIKILHETNISNAPYNKELYNLFFKPDNINIYKLQKLFGNCVPKKGDIDLFYAMMNFQPEVFLGGKKLNCGTTKLLENSIWWFPWVYSKPNYHSSLEEFAWKSIKYVNSNSQDDNLRIHISKLTKTEIEIAKDFVANDLISFARRGEQLVNIRKIRELYKKYFGVNDANYYNLALQQNCSSFQKNHILEAQDIILKLEQQLDLRTFTLGRFLFSTNRENHFPKLGFAFGELGMISAKGLTYCTNIMTIFTDILNDGLPSKELKQTLLKYYELEYLNNQLRDGDFMIPKYLTITESMNRFDIIFDTYFYYLKASHAYNNNQFSEAFENFLLFLSIKNPELDNLGEILPGERETFFKLLELKYKSEGPTTALTQKTIVALVENIFIDGIYNSFPKSYLDQFHQIDGNSFLLNTILSLLVNIHDKSVSENIFLLAQMGFTDPETLALGKKFQVPNEANVEKDLRDLLVTRAKQFDILYRELALRDNFNGETRDQLKQIQSTYEDSQKNSNKNNYKKIANICAKSSDGVGMENNDYKNFINEYEIETHKIWGDVTEQILKSNSAVIPAIIGKKSDPKFEIQIMSLVNEREMFPNTNENWPHLTEKETSNTKRKITRIFNPDIALAAYKNLKAIDEQISVCHPEVHATLTGRPLTISETQNLLEDDEILIFSVDNKAFEKLPIFMISSTNVAYKSHQKNTDLDFCLKHFEKLILHRNNSHEKCSLLLEKYFIPDSKFHSSKDVKKIKYVLLGALKSLPVGAVAIKSNENSKPLVNGIVGNTNKRGLLIGREKEFTTSITDISRYLYTEYNVSFLPSINSLNSFKYLNNVLPKYSEGFYGLGYSEINEIKNTALVDFDFQSLADIPNAEAEIIEISKILDFTNNIILLNQNFTKRNISKLKEKIRPKVLSVATHALKLTINEQLNSFLLVYGTDNSVESNLLSAREIDLINLRADIVLLSACETLDKYNGEISFDDNLVSSFLENGSKSVLATNWPIADEATRSFMVELSKEIKKDYSLSASLRNTSNKMLQTKYSHPYFWSGFRAIGE